MSGIFKGPETPTLKTQPTPMAPVPKAIEAPKTKLAPEVVGFKKKAGSDKRRVFGSDDTFAGAAGADSKLGSGL